MSTSKKPLWEKLMEEEPLDYAPGVEYRPCQFCGSLAYDEAEGEVVNGNVFEPTVCDQCYYGDLKRSGIPIH